MTLIVVATTDELRLLTKQERMVYEMYRHEGRKREEICAKMDINGETFRRYWWSAIRKIIQHRKTTENPQSFLAQGKDILGGDVRTGQFMPHSTKTISNVSALGREPVADIVESDESAAKVPVDDENELLDE